MAKTLRLLLGDQLNIEHPWFKDKNKDITYVLMEVMQEQLYVVHHIQKIVAFFLNMRHFAMELKQQGHHVIYFYLDAAENKQDIHQNLIWLKNKLGINKLEYQLPDEYRLDTQLQEIAKSFESAEIFDTDHFLTTREEIADFFKGKKQYLMENFYRYMRKKHHILVDHDLKPVGGEWNYDQQNRKKYDGKYPLKEPLKFKKDVTAIAELLEKMEVPFFGSLNKKDFTHPVGRSEALQLVDYFCEELLPSFGTYEDAMLKEHETLFHSKLSFALNIKLIKPLEVINKVLAAWKTNSENITIAQVEGFIRQVLGWREYMRGIYWAEMPGFAKKNYLNHTAELPSYFWDGKTKMNCMKHCLHNSLSKSYAHHIQRLMVIGNFSLLAGLHPDEVDKWYLGVYIDAVEWVQITNTRGMSQFADGGLVGTKPYVSSANYIDKMSNYCRGCYYDKNKKFGAKACPFNSMYWNFYLVHQDKLKDNQRVSLVYRLLDKMPVEDQEQLRKQAGYYLTHMNEL